MDAAWAQSVAFIVGTLATILAVRTGLRRTSGRDLFHPLVFPTLYVAIACLGPAAWIYFRGEPLGFITPSQLGPRYPALMAIAVVGFIMGAAIPFIRPEKQERPLDLKTLVFLGRLVALVPLGMAVLGLSRGMVLTRGQDQTIYTASDSVGVAAFLLTPATVTLILVGRSKQGRHSLMAPWDWLITATLVISLALSGRRAAALTVFLLILMIMAYRRGARLRIITGMLAVLAFAHTVVLYRIEAVGRQVQLSPVEVLLRDLGSVLFTTGATDAALSQSGDFRLGSSLIAAVIRQIPSPLTVPLLGPPADTGTLEFRELLGFTNQDQGFGYSIPAEGALNFGIIGILALSLAAGAGLAWLYARFDLDGNRALNWAYLIAVATLPFAWRSDVLGAIKGVLYPLIFMAMAAGLARLLYDRFVRPRVALGSAPTEARRR